jgi:uncharacterized glyoxalase superfamily protein PhnB
MAQIIPQLSVLDVQAYVAFLRDAFGFEVAEDWRDPSDPDHVNIEMSLGEARIGIGRAQRARRVPKEDGVPTMGLYVVVEDVDAHHERARAAGAEITFPLADQPWGHRMYGAVDPEGHEWGFAAPIMGPL